jgi:5-methylcytosine-specific restriction endonuclease McrA
MVVRKIGRMPPISKQEVVNYLDKTRDIEDYTSNKVPMQSDKLKIRLLNENYLEPRCAMCGITRWLDGEVPLQLDHKDGNKDNNSLKNLRLLCPNCHALTPQYRLKNEFKGETYSNRDNSDGNRA